MTAVKSALARTLRFKVATQPPRLWSGVSRGISSTTKDATSITSTTAATTSTTTISIPFPASEVQRLPSYSRPHPTHFDTLISSLTKTLITPTATSPLPQLHDLLRSYTSNRTHWSKYALENPSKQYTRNLVCEKDDLFNLLILVWTPGKRSPVHDHADAHCLMKVLQGSLQETRYAIPSKPGLEGPLVQTSKSSFGLNKVSYMADVLGLHSIANPSSEEYAVSLHLYFPPNAATRGSKVYDVESGEVDVCMGSYDSVGGEVV